MRFLHIIVCNRRKSYAYLVHFCFQRFPSRVAAQESSRDSGTERQLVAGLRITSSMRRSIDIVIEAEFIRLLPLSNNYPVLASAFTPHG